MSRAHGWLTAIVLAPLLGGCNGGCSDVVVSDSVRVLLEQATVGEGHLLRVELCQDGSCSEIETPAAEAAITLSLRELSPALDLDEPGEITATVTDAAGRVTGAASAPFDFEDRTAAGDCESARRQLITVEPSRR